MHAPTRSSSVPFNAASLLAGVPAALLTSLVIIAGTTLTWIAWRTTSLAEARSAQTALAMHAGDIESAIEDRLLAYEGLLRAGVGLMQAQWPVSPAQWETFVAQLSLAGVYPGIQGVGFTTIVRSDEDLVYWRNALEPLGLHSRVPLASAGDRLPRSAIVMLEPRDDRNLRAYGFDMMSEPVRRAAMERARDEGLPALTSKVRLVQEFDPRTSMPGFLLYVPLYSTPTAPADVAARRTALRGFVYAPFRAGDFFGSTHEVADAEAVFEVIDGDAPDGPVLYQSAQPPSSGMHEVRKLTLAGHVWTLRVWAGRDLDGGPRAARVIALGGGAITFLLAAIVSVLGFGRQDLRERAESHRAFAQREREMKEHLEERVAERTSELELANRDLSAANRDLEAFAYTISHDLRTPLRAVNGHVERFLASADSVNEAQERHASAIHRNVSRMAQMIEDLLSFAVVSRRPLEKRRVQLAAVLRPMIEELQAAHRITVEMHPEELGAVHADPLLLQQALSNLLSNAVKFSRHAEQPRVWIGVEQHGAERVYFIRDNGVGFDMQYAGKLFGVFERLHHQHEFEGLGVGLAIVKQIIERHGGRIWASAAPGQGAAFFFTLGD